MLSTIYSLWDIGYPLYTYSSIFIIFLIIWQVKRSYRGLSFEPKRSCCPRHRKVRQRARDAASRARRLSQEEAEKPQELFSVMKRQRWLPGEGTVRRLLCADPCCGTCNSAVLEIQQLLACESRPLPFPELPQESSCLGTSMSSVSFEQHLEHCCRYSRKISGAPVTPTLTQLSEHITQSTSSVSIQEYYTDDLQVGQEFQLADILMVPEIVASSNFEELMVPQNKQETESKPDLVQENQDHQYRKSSISLLSQNSEITNLSCAMALPTDSVFPTHLPFLSPRVRRLLEVHVKKWIHFQKWGLPRRVEESLRHFMPDPTLFCQSRKKLSSILNKLSNVTADKIGTISHQTTSSYLAGQPTRTCWVSEWSVIDLDQRNHCYQIQNFRALPVTSQDEPLSGFYSLPGEQTDGSEINLQEKYNQLFCGLPSLHSESLVATFLDSEGLSKNKYMSKLSLKDPHLLKELSLFPLLPKTPLKSVSSFSPTSPNSESPHEHQGAQISVPFLTLAECETLESHLLHRQLRLHWGLPAVFLRTQQIQSHIKYEACDKSQLPDTMKIFWPENPFSVLNKKLFFPEPARRLLEFHLQRQLIHFRWGLPQRIQKSIQLFLSSTEEQPLTWSNPALPSAGTPQPGEQEADGNGHLFSPTVAKESISLPHLFAQVRETLQSHINSKCRQIQQSQFPTTVQSSWEGRIPGDLAGASYPSIPQDHLGELQATNDHDLYQDIVLMALDHEQQALPGAVIEHCKRPQALSEETIEKLETTLRHKYLTFLSGLPALYCMALSRATSPAVPSQSEITGTGSVPSHTPQEPLPQPHERLEPGVHEDSKAHADSEAETQPEVQEGGKTEPGEHQTHPAARIDNISAKLNFHFKKKVLAIQLGIPERAREFKEPAEKSSTHKALETVSNQGNAELQKRPIPPDFLPTLDAKSVHYKDQLTTELRAVCHKQKQLSSKAVPDGSAHQASKQLGRDLTEAQVLFVQQEVSGNHLQEPWGPEPQGPGKSEHSAHEPTLAEEGEDPEKPKAAGDFGEGDAGLGLFSRSERRPPAGDQRPEVTLLTRTAYSSWHSFYLVDPCPDGSQQTPQLNFPEPPPEVPGGKEPQPDSHTKLNVTLEPTRIPENALPTVARASQSHPFLNHTIQGRLLQGQPVPRPGMPATAHKRPSLPESAWRDKMKSFLHSINSKMKGKGRVESMLPTPGTVARTRKDNVDKSPTPAKSLTEKSKTRKPRGPKGKSAPTEKPVGPAFLTGTHSPDSKLQPSSASGPGYPRHCPRHCPRMACCTQVGNPP